MKSNLAMRTLLEKHGMGEDILSEGSQEVLRLKSVDGCVFLAREYELSRTVQLKQFPDRTGYECFVNRVHLKVGHGKHALEQVFDYVSLLRRSLLSFGKGIFEIIISIADGESVVRFHQCRLGESWLSDDLEGYKFEAVLAIVVSC